MGRDADEWGEVVERLRDVAPEKRWQSVDVARLYEIALRVAPSLLARFSLPEGLPQDMASDLLTQRLNKLVDCGAKPFTLLAVSLWNRAKSWKRHQRVQANHREREAASEPEPIDEDDGGKAEDRRMKAWAVLTDKEKDIFERLSREEPRDDIAKTLDTSRANVDQIISRARKRLKQKGLS